MRIIAAADAARCPRELERIRSENRQTDLFLCLGEPLMLAAGWSLIPDSCILCLGGHRILAGQAGASLRCLAEEAGARNCDVVLSFSPYAAWCVELNGILVVAPGSLVHSANRMPRSYALLDLRPGRLPSCSIQWLQRPAQGLEGRDELLLRQGSKRYPDA